MNQIWTPSPRQVQASLSLVLVAAPNMMLCAQLLIAPPYGLGHRLERPVFQRQVADFHLSEQLQGRHRCRERLLQALVSERLVVLDVALDLTAMSKAGLGGAGSVGCMLPFVK